MMNCVLSIDIGTKNLGWTVFAVDAPKSFKQLSAQAPTIEDIKLTFGIYNISMNIMNNESVVTERCKAVKMFFSNIARNFNIEYAIIERQVPTNTCAMELMYAITSIAQCYTNDFSDVIIFDPKLKFDLLRVPYNTKNKAHKHLSINICRSVLCSIAECKVTDFDKFDKRDDIADSFNQGFEWLCFNNHIQYSLLQMRKLF